MLAAAFSERFKDDPDVLIFASGVSNSQEVRASEFQRERHKLLAAIESFGGSRFAYFGSCGVVNNLETLSPYLLHKLEMESLVRSHPAGFVFRLPQVVGRTPNPNTLTNFLYEKITTGNPFTVWANAERNLIDIDDIASIATVLLSEKPQGSDMAVIASARSVPSLEIVHVFERVLGKAGNYTIMDKGDPLNIEAERANEIARSMGIDLGGDYIERLVRKYGYS